MPPFILRRLHTPVSEPPVPDEDEVVPDDDDVVVVVVVVDCPVPEPVPPEPVPLELVVPVVVVVVVPPPDVPEFALHIKMLPPMASSGAQHFEPRQSPPKHSKLSLQTSPAFLPCGRQQAHLKLGDPFLLHKNVLPLLVN